MLSYAIGVLCPCYLARDCKGDANIVATHGPDTYQLFDLAFFEGAHAWYAN